MFIILPEMTDDYGSVRRDPAFYTKSGQKTWAFLCKPEGLFQLYVNQLHVASGRPTALDVEHIQMLEKGRQLGIAVIPHIKIRIALDQQAADGAGADPVVLIGVFQHNGADSRLDGIQIRLGLDSSSRRIRVG